jgi:hypothetical protein
MLSGLEIDPKRVQKAHLNGYYPVSRGYCAFPQLYALQSFAHREGVLYRLDCKTIATDSIQL